MRSESSDILTVTSDQNELLQRAEDLISILESGSIHEY